MPRSHHALRLRHALLSFSAAALLASGCGALLGLDEFTDAAVTGNEGGGGAGGGGAGPDAPSCKVDDTRACYDGASETEGVGVCAPGTQTCGEDGEWGECKGQVLPGEEDCNRRGDEDCDGVGCSDVAWAKVFNAAGSNQFPTSVAISPKGDRIALAGLYMGEANFGPDDTTALPARPNGGAFLAIFDGEGNHVHSRGLPTGDGVPAVALDAESNVLFAARYKGAVNLGGEVLTPSGSDDMLVVKLDPMGQHVWSKHFGGPEDQLTQPIDLAVAPDGDPVITGFFEGVVTFGGASLESMGPSDMDAFLVRLNGEDGSHVYSVRIGDSARSTPNTQWGKGVGVDALGRAVVAGTFVSSIDFGADRTHTASATKASGWVAQYDAKGALIWETVFARASGGNVEVSGVDVDPAGNTGIVGLFSGDVAFQGTNDQLTVRRGTTGAEDIDLFVLRLSETGTHQWSKQIGDASDQSWNLPFQGVALDQEGDLVFAGAFRGKANFGGGELVADDIDWFVAKFNASGTHRWSHRYGGGAAFQGAISAAIHHETRDIIVAGVTDGTIDLTDPPLEAENLGVVLARIAP